MQRVEVGAKARELDAEVLSMRYWEAASELTGIDGLARRQREEIQEKQGARERGRVGKRVCFAH